MPKQATPKAQSEDGRDPQVQFRLPKPEILRLDAFSIEKGISRSEAIRRALRQYLKRAA